VIKTYALPLGENRSLRARFPYLVSHLSNDNGIVEFKTSLDSAYQEIAEICYVDTMTNVEKIIQALKSDTLTVSYTDGRVGKVKNMFDFK
jgi:hypothetical protein